MLFYTYSFMFIFFPIVLSLVYCAKNNKLFYLSTLTCSSFIFYIIWNLSDFYLLIFSIIINYFLGKKLYQKQYKTHLIFGIIFNLGLLAWFKYAFFINSLSLSLLGYGFTLNKIALPLAISFYTFEQIAYIVDSYKGIMIKHNFLEYLFLISFFPRLIAGPIIQPTHMLIQLKQKVILNFENLSMGFTIFVIGLFKKIVIADYFAFFVDTNFIQFGNPSYYPGFVEAWSTSLSYALQIYFDFSGYSDMAIGLALIFGIKLPLNFDSPYKSKSIIEFWRRWHISLSSFLRDYLYIPLGGNQKGEFRKYVNLIIVMLLGGIWHGANFTFLIWGGLHGLFLCIRFANEF